MKKLSERKKKWIERTVENDRSYKVFLYNRFFAFALSVLLQVVGYAVLLLLLVYQSAYALVLQLVVFVLEIVFILYILNTHDRPSLKLNWIIAILVAPVFGVPMYLINGRGRPTRKMGERIARAKAQNDEEARAFFGEKEYGSEEGSLSRYLERYGGYPMYQDGNIEYYESGEKIFPVILEELKKAEKYIFVEYFIIAHGRMWNEILKILVEKAMLGVKVRIVYDDFGCMMTLPPKYDRYLEGLHENIKCMTFNDVVPLFAVRMNNRDHRKLLVIDGKVAFTGGFNLADEYINEKRRFGYWKDSGLKLTGGAVNSFVRMFLWMWNAFRKDGEEVAAYLSPVTAEKREGFAVQPYDDSPLDKLSVGETAYMDIVNRAKKYVYIFTPYLVLDDAMRTALCQAAMRGVDVRIVTPGIPDKKMTYRLTRANYDILLKAGVRIYEYSPGFIHSKSMVTDDECAVVGTINLDYRSLYHHFENAVYFSGCEAVAAVKRDAEETFALSKERTEENFKRGVVGRLVDSLLRVFETLL
ncbi:MAG: cardiolipin synthase [Clostridia bacterium]|nr:cardiolipin synthase [Clostridia bacterium]